MEGQLNEKHKNQINRFSIVGVRDLVMWNAWRAQQTTTSIKIECKPKNPGINQTNTAANAYASSTWQNWKSPQHTNCKCMQAQPSDTGNDSNTQNNEQWNACTCENLKEPVKNTPEIRSQTAWASQTNNFCKCMHMWAQPDATRKNHKHAKTANASETI